MDGTKPSLGNSGFGAFTFFASLHPGEVCGSNGLPLTPNSVKILGRAQELKTIVHPNLCTYVDVIRGKHEQLKVVCEYYGRTLRAAWGQGEFREASEAVSVANQCLKALAFLNNRYLVVARNICPENVQVAGDGGTVKLFNYGMYYVTDGGRDITFPIGHPKYLPPEVYLSECVDSSPPDDASVDVWSLGLMVLELVLGTTLWEDLKLIQVIRKVISLIHCQSVIDRIALEHNCTQTLQSLPESLRDFLSKCLTVMPTARPDPADLLGHPVFLEFEIDTDASIPDPGANYFLGTHPRSKGLTIESLRAMSWNGSNVGGSGPTTLTDSDHMSERGMKEVYHIWQLAGGDVDSALKTQEMVRFKPPVLSIPNMMLLEGKTFGQRKDCALLWNPTVVTLPLQELRKRLSHIPPESYYPLILEQEEPESPQEASVTESLPLVIRERDIEYQFHRVVLFERLLKGYPFTRAQIIREARKDVPPLYRAQVWAALLELEGNIVGRYSSVDKETPCPTDRQIEVDIPRCHQYDELLSSPSGHAKFKRVLKAWVVSHPGYVYWQGLDSLCAPFLYLNFNREDLAYACLSAFVPKYLHGFFLKDNSAVIQEYLVTFSHLVAFHDAQLTNHLDDIGFIPELYAIPWFLTMFSHVFPLHKIFHLWDKLLLGDSSFPLCVGLAILMQLRDTLLSSGFNECILLFSDMPEVDIERCVKDSVEIFCSTPKSVTYRQHQLQVKKKGRSKEKTTSVDLGMDPISLSDLKSEKCPRISAEDMLDLLDLQHVKFSKPKAMVVDIRGADDYARGTIPTAINVPLDSGEDPQKFLAGSKGKVIVVCGKNVSQASGFAAGLVRAGYSRVCVLHKGIDVLRTTGLLAVPSCM